MKEIWRGGNNERLSFNNYSVDHATNKPVFTDVDPSLYCSYTTNDINIPSVAWEPALSAATGKYYVDIDARTIQDEGVLDVTWQWDGNPSNGLNRERKSQYRIITPYLDIDTLINIFPDATFDELKGAEHYARTVIDNYTGQTFGKAKKHLTMFGRGTDYLISQEHILEVHSAFLVRSTNPETPPPSPLYAPPHEHHQYEPVPGPLSVSTTGYAVKWGRRSRLPRVAQPGIYYDWEDDITFEDNSRPGTIIGHNAGIFIEDARYDVFGLFGYAEVPTDIVAAAEMLASDFFCRDREWKENYIKKVDSDAWTFEFHEKAFTGTGNLLVDNLLSDWIWHRMVVI